MFSHVSVILSTGRVPGQVPPGRYTPGRYAPWAGTPPPAGTPRAGTTPRQVHPPGGYTPLGRYTPWAGSPPATVHAGIQLTSGRYASYWNAFLLNYKNSSNVLNRHFTFQTEKRTLLLFNAAVTRMGVLFTFGEHLVFLSHYISQTQKEGGLHLKFLI